MAIMGKRKSSAKQQSAIEGLESRLLMSAVMHPAGSVLTPQSNFGIQGLTPAQVSSAYGFDQIKDGSTLLTGRSQCIALVDAFYDPTIVSDLKVFDQQFNLPDPVSFTVVNQTGGSPTHLATNAGWASETAMDVEWAHAMAPYARILLVESNDDNTDNLVAGVKYARSAQRVSVVSMSWGGSEFQGQLADDAVFTTPAGHRGVTFVSSSGDDTSGAEWPASSPDVVGVGGTTLNLVGGGYSSETAWGSGSGGASSYENEPSFQKLAQSTGNRTTPDVAYEADPNVGFAVYDSTGSGGWTVIAGTSAGAPQWASLFAVINQGRKHQSESALIGNTETLPALYSVYGAVNTSNYSNYVQYYHDITSGGPSGNTASMGYDTITGLGSPIAQYVAKLLIGAKVSNGAFVSSAKLQSAFAPGSTKLMPQAAREGEQVANNNPETNHNSPQRTDRPRGRATDGPPTPAAAAASQLLRSPSQLFGQSLITADALAPGHTPATAVASRRAVSATVNSFMWSHLGQTDSTGNNATTVAQGDAEFEEVAPLAADAENVAAVQIEAKPVRHTGRGAAIGMAVALIAEVGLLIWWHLTHSKRDKPKRRAELTITHA